MLKIISKFAMDILPSVVATIIGAYIVNHYIVTRPSAEAPVAAAVSPADPNKAQARADTRTCLLYTSVLFFAQRALIFPAPQTTRTAPAAAGFPQVEEHLLTTADGEKVIIWHVPARPGHAVVLYFHGNGDYLAGFFGRFHDLIADGTGIVALSYRGYAGSSGKPSEQGLLQDAAAAYAFTAARYRAETIVAVSYTHLDVYKRQAW